MRLKHEVNVSEVSMSKNSEVFLRSSCSLGTSSDDASLLVLLLPISLFFGSRAFDSITLFFEQDDRRISYFVSKHES